jgi:alkanesulfonate monooxygenase SsuD/methylene tetrahydromethanopterin reductase-like flavin-dependent oxidoreductase (luciferase family)
MFGFTLPTLEQTQRELGRYREYLAAHQGDPGRLNGHVQQPIIGLARHLYVADTDRAAEEEARPAYSQFRENFLSRPPASGEMPAAIQAMQRENWPEFVEHGGIFVGAPETVRRSLQHYIDTLGVDYVVGVFAFGNLPVERVLASMRLFLEQVAPNLRPAARPASAARSGS